MGGSSGGGETRHAAFLEHRHRLHLDRMDTIVASFESAGPGYGSPFQSYTDIDIENAFFGAGLSIDNYMSLYELFGHCMLNLDTEALYAQIFASTTHSAEISDLISAEAALMEDDMETNIIPRFQTGMRDINSVMSSTYVIGRSLIEEARVKQIAKFSSELRYRLIPVAVDRWKTTVQRAEQVVRMHAELLKLYYAADMDITELNYNMKVRDKLWPFTVLEYHKAALGAMGGAVPSPGVSGVSQTQKAIGGALSGAATGATLTGGNPIGTVIGGVVGLAASFL